MVAVDCPPDLRPRNATAAIKAAVANGWKWECKLAAGFAGQDVELTWSVIVRVRKDGVRMVGCWEGATKDEMGWHNGWRRSPEGALSSLSWTQFSNAIKGVEPEPTAKAAADILEQQQTMLRAISALRPIAWPVQVLAVGIKDRDCKGKVAINAVGLPFLPCANKTNPDEPICSGCSFGLLFDGTVDPPKPSKKKTKEYTP